MEKNQNAEKLLKKRNKSVRKMTEKNEDVEN